MMLLLSQSQPTTSTEEKIVMIKCRKQYYTGRPQLLIVILFSCFSCLRVYALVHPRQSTSSTRWVPSSPFVLPNARLFPTSTSLRDTQRNVRSQVLLTTTKTDGSDNSKVRLKNTNDNYFSNIRNHLLGVTSSDNLLRRKVSVVQNA